MKKSIIITALLCIVSMLVIDKSDTAYNGIWIPIAGLGIVSITAVILLVKKRFSVETSVILLFALGFIIRLYYVSYTTLTPDVFVRQHDLRAFGTGEGHSAYIGFFADNGIALPDFDPTSKSQFYHPPLHHFIAGIFMRTMMFLGMDYARAVGSIQFLTLFYSACCMIVSERIFDLSGLKHSGKLIAVAIVAFHPTFIILAGSINNDILSVLWILMAVYGCLKWCENPCIKRILPIAVYIGLGMSTKLSAALIAIPVGIVFLIKLVQAFRLRCAKEYIVQYSIFGAVCIPLGMWFYVRNYIQYQIPFSYVLRLADDSPQYIGFRSVWERLFDFSYRPFDNVFLNNPYYHNSNFFEYNPFAAILKTSLFGEYDYSYISMIVPFCTALFWINAVLVGVSVIAGGYCMLKKDAFPNNIIKVLVLVFHAVTVVQFIIFALEYPHTCSMDFRYIVPTVVMGALYIGIVFERVSCIRAWKMTGISLTAIFCMLSFAVYTILN